MEHNRLHNINLLTISIFAAALFIPFLGDVHLFDWDEINFAESAREMLITKDYFRVHINFQPFWEKPPLFFWLQAGSMKIFGVNEFSARFPNAVCGIITIATLFHIGRKHFSQSLALWWVLFMTGSFTPHLYFKSGIIDPWFNLFIFLTIYQLYLSTINDEQEYKSKRFLLAGIFCGLAVITKGPVALLVTCLCVAAWLVIHRFVTFFSFRLFLLAAIPFSLISFLWVASELGSNGPSVLYDFIMYQVDLFKNPVAGHGQPFWYHPVVLLFGCFPASVFAFKGFATTTDQKEQKNLKLWMSIMFWVVLVLFSIVTTKIVHYSSLCYMPLTFMAALAVDKKVKSFQRFNRLTILSMLLIGGLIGLLLAALPLIDSFKESITPYIKDPFAVDSLNIEGPWAGYEFAIGVIFLAIVCAATILLFQNRGATPLYLVLGAYSLLIPAYLKIVVPKIEAYSQGPAIEFYESLRNRDVYVESLGHKSYAQYFYSGSQPQANPNYKDMNWLLAGPIDKPVYFVVKTNNLPDYALFNLREVARKGGFVLVVREPVTAQ